MGIPARVHRRKEHHLVLGNKKNGGIKTRHWPLLKAIKHLGGQSSVGENNRARAAAKPGPRKTRARDPRGARAVPFLRKSSSAEMRPRSLAFLGLALGPSVAHTGSRSESPERLISEGFRGTRVRAFSLFAARLDVVGALMQPEKAERARCPDNGGRDSARFRKAFCQAPGRASNRWLARAWIPRPRNGGTGWANRCRCCWSFCDGALGERVGHGKKVRAVRAGV